MLISMRVFALSLAILFFQTNSSLADSRELRIRPAYQETVVWCWAAVSEMVFRRYRVPNLNPAGNFQCGIVGSLGGACWNDCRFCITPIGSTFQMAQVLENYQSIANRRVFRAVPEPRMSFRQIVREIDQGNPVVAGISPSGMGGFYPDGMSEHVALIVGYDENGGGWLKVNDPMPYRLLGYDPYSRAGAELDRRGAYWIRYETFARHLGYKDTIRLRP